MSRALILACLLTVQFSFANDEGSLFPMEIGDSYTYEVKTMGIFGKTCPNGPYRVRVEDKVLINEKEAFRLKGRICDSSGVDYVALGQNDRAYAWGNGAWAVILDGPVEEDHRWEMARGLWMRWESVGEFKTRAGTFSNCWRRVQEMENKSYSIFCRNIGLVYYTYESQHGFIRAELESATHFKSNLMTNDEDQLVDILSGDFEWPGISTCRKRCNDRYSWGRNFCYQSYYSCTSSCVGNGSCITWCHKSRFNCLKSVTESHRGCWKRCGR